MAASASAQPCRVGTPLSPVLQQGGTSPFQSAGVDLAQDGEAGSFSGDFEIEQSESL